MPNRAPPEPSSPDAPTASVLLVDDHEPNLLALEAVLEPLRARLVRASSGTEALGRLLREDFAAIVLDVQMPGLDGFETAQLIRQRDRSRETPILFVTAIHRGELHQAKGYAHGAVDYLTKPFNPDVLRAKVAALAGLWQRGEALRLREAGLHERERADLLARERVAQAEADVQRTRLRGVVEASGAGLWSLDLATEEIATDEPMIRLMGLPPGSSLTLASALAAIHPEDRDRVSRAVASAVAGENGGRYMVEFRTGGAAGAPARWVESRGQGIADPDGRVTHLAGVMVDISGRKEAEATRERLLRALGESEARYRLATRATKDAIRDWNLGTDSVSWSEGLQELFGYTPGDVAPTAAWWADAIHPDDRARVVDGLRRVCESPARNEWQDEYRFRRSDGSYADVADRGWVAREGSGQAERLVSALQDVTERRVAEALQARQVRHSQLAGRGGHGAHPQRAAPRDAPGVRRGSRASGGRGARPHLAPASRRARPRPPGERRPVHAPERGARPDPARRARDRDHRRGEDAPPHQ